MNWLRKKNPFTDDAPGASYGATITTRSTSMAPPRSSNEHDLPHVFRTYSATTPRRSQQDIRYNNNGERYENDDDDTNDHKLFRTASNTYDFNAVTTTPVTEPGGETATETSEETLVTIHGAMVHLVDEDGSPVLAQGSFSVVRIEQAGNGIVAFVRVGDDLRWPLTQDEPAVKLDSTHYFFTIRVPRPVDQMAKETAGDPGNEILSYGVTFSVSGQERQLQELDSLLEQYSNFSAPQLVHGDRQQQIVPEDVVSSEGKQVLLCPFYTNS